MITVPTRNTQKSSSSSLPVASESLPLSLIHMSTSTILQLPELHHDNSESENTDVLPSHLNLSGSKTNISGQFYFLNAQDQAHIFYQVQILQIAG